MQPEPCGAVTTRVQIPAEGARTRHYWGLPPKLTGGVDTRRDMQPAALVLAQPAGDGSWYLDRFARDGSFAGNTWHETWADAMDQLEFEYLPSFAFELVPEGVPDPKAYAEKLAGLD